MAGENAINAFKQQRARKDGNTESTGDKLFLFGNCIAKWENGVDLYISDGNYPLSSTTKDRLWKLGANLYTKRGIHYLNNEVWNGDWIKIDEVPNQKEVESTLFV